MKLECSTEKIKNAVFQTERITGKNLSLPILNSILLIATGNVLKLRAMNLSLGIEINIPAKIEKEGILAINGSVLSNVFSNINQSENVLLEGENNNLLIKTKKSNIKIKGQPSDDFPTIPIVSGDSFEIEADKLTEGIKSVYYSSSVSDIKPEISSVYVYSDDDSLIFVSTDSFRLAEKKIKLKKVLDIKGLLIPFKNITEILKIFNDTSKSINICFNSNQISFSCENIYLTSRLIDGVFPDYRQIIPKESSTEVVLLKQDLLNGLKLTNVFSDKFNQLNLKINNQQKIFELSSFNNDIGENRTNIDSVIKGKDIEISFNYKYFLDCFTSINTDSLVVYFTDSQHPILIKPINDNSFIYLIMPMNR